VLSFDARPFPRKETCLVEGQTSCSALLARALTLVGCLDWTFRPCFLRPDMLWVIWWARLQKE